MQLNHIDPDGASGADIEHVIETWLKQQARFRLPGDRETVIYPLTFTHRASAAAAGPHSGGPGDKGTRGDSQQDDSLHAGSGSGSGFGGGMHGDSLHEDSLHGSGLHGDGGQAEAASADGTLLGLLVAEAPEPLLAAPIQDAPPAVEPAAVDYVFAQTSGVSCVKKHTTRMQLVTCGQFRVLCRQAHDEAAGVGVYKVGILLMCEMLTERCPISHRRTSASSETLSSASAVSCRSGAAAADVQAVDAGVCSGAAA